MKNSEEILQNTQDFYDSLSADTAQLSKTEEYVTSAGEKLLSTSKFEEMGLKDEILSSLRKMKYDKPSLIQSTAIPLMVEKNSVSVQSKSGTGKTAAFAVGILQNLVIGETSAIVMSPTHELNAQIAETIRKIGADLKVGVLKAVKRREITEVREEVIVSCPRLMNYLIMDKIVDPEKIKIVVIDEADATLTDEGGMGIEAARVLKACKNAQKVFFSATFTSKIKKVIGHCGKMTEIYEDKNEKPDQIKIFHVELSASEKVKTLFRLYEILPIAQTIVFCNTREKVDSLRKIYTDKKFAVSYLHGGLENKERESSVESFKNAKTKVLISTDVFGRGMDIVQANLIINFDIPDERFEKYSENYIHRIGRSGRFGRAGFVIDFVANKDELAVLVKICEQLNCVSKLISIECLEQVYASRTSESIKDIDL